MYPTSRLMLGTDGERVNEARTSGMLVSCDSPSYGAPLKMLMRTEAVRIERTRRHG